MANAKNSFLNIYAPMEKTRPTAFLLGLFPHLAKPGMKCGTRSIPSYSLCERSPMILVRMDSMQDRLSAKLNENDKNIKNRLKHPEFVLAIRWRDGKEAMKPDQVSLAHGNGGRFMRELLEELVFPELGMRESNNDASLLAPNGRIPCLASDSFTVQPLFFPGGNIGNLAIHGTLNDLAVSGAEPAALTVNLVIEEGFSIETFRQILASAGTAAREASVPIVGGDTKVVPHGQGAGLVIATTGLGWREPYLKLGIDRVQAQDAVIVSGPVGDHGATVMMAREHFGLSSELVSDSACVLPLARLARGLPGLRFMRDPTRGGLATVLHEIRHASRLGVRIDEKAIPIREEVRGFCGLLGLNPLTLACEGRIVAICAPESADELLKLWHGHPLGREAMRIGELEEGGTVSLVTALGGRRFIDELGEDPLPRIC